MGWPGWSWAHEARGGIESRTHQSCLRVVETPRVMTDRSQRGLMVMVALLYLGEGLPAGDSWVEVSPIDMGCVDGQ